MVFRFFNSCNFWKIKIKNKKETQLDGKEKRQEKKRSTACINMMTVNLYDSMEDDILCHCGTKNGNDVIVQVFPP